MHLIPLLIKREIKRRSHTSGIKRRALLLEGFHESYLKIEQNGNQHHGEKINLTRQTA